MYMPRAVQVSGISTREVKKPSQASWQFTVFSDESVKLNDLSLDLLTSLLEKKPSLSPLFTESSSQEAKKAGDQQMSPELLNKAFSTKSTQYIC